MIRGSLVQYFYSINGRSQWGQLTSESPKNPNSINIVWHTELKADLDFLLLIYCCTASEGFAPLWLKVTL